MAAAAASSSTPAAVREMQRDLESQANALSKIQKGTLETPPFPSPSFSSVRSFPLADISKNHQVRKQYTIQVGENELVLKACPARRALLLPLYELELVNDEANVYKLIGPVLVKQDLAEAKANVKKRIEYISAELKRMDRALKDLEEKQNSKKESACRGEQF
uniref:Prefoldin subunit 6 n=1 Tax=Oryza barthii TaxID=65489 RepID=A0A0D3F316_9ORYZ